MHLLLGLIEVHRSSPQTPMQEGHYTCTCSNWDMVPWGVSDGHLVLQTCIGHPRSRLPHRVLLPDSPHCHHGTVRFCWCSGIHPQGET